MRSSFDKLVLGDPGGFDAGPAWLDRLIWAKRKGEQPRQDDEMILLFALRALAAIA